MPSGKKNDVRCQIARTKPSPYVRSVLSLYTELPHTPTRPRPDDGFVVSRLERQKHPLLRVQSALLLGTARRLFRLDQSDPLQPIRSFRFFLPIVDELRYARLDLGYAQYLLRKISDALGKQLTLQIPEPPTPHRERRRSPQQLELPW